MDINAELSNFSNPFEEKDLQHYLQKGNNPNARDEHGLTLLHHASYWGQVELCDALIRAGAKVNATKKNKPNGLTPLHYASLTGQADVVQALIDAGADIHAKGPDGRTPLDLCNSQEANAFLCDYYFKNIKAKTRDVLMHAYQEKQAQDDKEHLEQVVSDCLVSKNNMAWDMPRRKL